MHASTHGHGEHRPVRTAEEEKAILGKELLAALAEIEDRNERQAENETQEVYETIGDALGWHNVTSDPDKVADVEILAVTARNVDLLIMHHRIRDLLEANARWGGDLFSMIKDKDKDGDEDLLEDTEHIYRRLDTRSSIQVEIIGDKYKNNPKDPNEPPVVMDLRDMAQLLRIEEYNKYLGKDKFSTEDLRMNFITGKPLVKMIRGKEMRDGKEVGTITTVDLRLMCPKDSLKDFDFDDYVEMVKKEQVGFQRLGVTREDQLKGQHPENASHTMFVKTGRLQPNGNPEFMWMPTCATTAAYDARTDLPKQRPGERAGGHPHAFGKYNEDTGCTVEVDVAMLTMHRGSIQLKDHNGTNDRMNHAAVGMNAKDKMLIKGEQQVKTKNGRTFNGRVAVIGGERKGKIYKALHKTYDSAMEKTRGFKLTNEEADDLIMTDIIGPWIAANQADWLMCFANSTNNLNYSYQKAITQGGEVWSDYGKRGGQNFCVAIPCRQMDADDPQENGLKYFFDYNELITYVNGRIKEGHIQGVNTETQISIFKGLTEDEVQQALDARDSDNADEENPVDHLDAGQLGALKGLAEKLFGKNEYQAVWQKFVDANDVSVNVQIGTETYVFYDFIEKKLQSTNFDEIQVITGSTDEEGKKRLLEIIRRMTPRLQQGFLNYARTGQELEKVEPSSLPPKVVNQIGLQLRNGGDFSIAVSRCWKYMEDKPGFEAYKQQIGPFKEAAESTTKKKGGEKKATMQVLATDWGAIMLRAGKILTACKDQGVDKIDPDARRIIQEKAQDPGWLIREAIIQMAKPEFLKEIEGN